MATRYPSQLYLALGSKAENALPECSLDNLNHFNSF
jgi:hypothetical protein